ncbi:hypothetical protein KA025_01485 [Candidatus Saccharibacteria bacterium]|nr:hypothetical protein [Candidatus Saccharibacteria bacterium]MBP7834737.1 hypothetical protein [Candidatus Saccharibacteria bacterium]
MEDNTNNQPRTSEGLELKASSGLSSQGQILVGTINESVVSDINNKLEIDNYLNADPVNTMKQKRKYKRSLVTLVVGLVLWLIGYIILKQGEAETGHSGGIEVVAAFPFLLAGIIIIVTESVTLIVYYIANNISKYRHK